jgi:hypothetical protein
VVKRTKIFPLHFFTFLPYKNEVYNNLYFPIGWEIQCVCMIFFVHIGEKYHQAKNCFNASCQVPSPTDHPFQI